jgi:hypothetical protein
MVVSSAGVNVSYINILGIELGWAPVAAGAGKKGGARGAAKFREETSKKADSAVKDRIAATHNLGGGSFVCKRYFAAQHRNGVDNSATGE